MARQSSFSRFVVFLLLVALSLMGALALGWSSYGEQMNHYAADWFFRLRGEQKEGTAQIAIVAIDDETVKRFGWPLDRSVLATALKNICSGNPRVVGIDLLFTEYSNPDSDQALAAALEACRRTVLASRLAKENVTTLEAEQWADPLPEFAKMSAAVAHAHADPDKDGVSRRILLAKAAGAQRHWALALEVFRIFAGHQGPIIEDEQTLLVATRIIPAPRDRAATQDAAATEGGGSQRLLLINYAGREGVFPSYPLGRLVEAGPGQNFAGRAVLIGATAQGLGVSDRKFTPFSTAGRDMAGVEIHANILNTLMTGQFLRPMRDSAEMGAMTAIAAAVAVVLLALRGWWLGAALVFLAAAVHAAPYLLFSRRLLVAPAFSVSLAFWAPLLVGGTFQYATVWRHYVAADAGRRRLRDRLEMVSHEMRSPLTAIQGSSEVMSRYDLEEDRRKQLADLIHRESQRLATMVERFLDVERLEAGEIELRLEPVPLEALVERTLERIQPLVRRKNIQLKTTVKSQPQAIGDSELLEFALYNLVSNAVKYSPPSTTVEVTVRSNVSLGLAFLDVSDQGAGIPREDQPRIFDRFYRSESAKRSGQPGLGLGLAIVREIARHHGGSVLVESTPGRGSKFSLALPLGDGG